MNNPRLAARYAKSVLTLSVEQNQLEAVYADMKFIRFICKSNPDFTAILKSPVFSSDKKEKLIESVTRESISKLTTLFIRLLIRKHRESALPEITEAFIEQYNEIKKIHKVKLTTAVEVSAEIQEVIVRKVKADTPFQQVELEAYVDESIIGGFKIEIGDTLIDASISRDLNDIRKQFMSNDYIQRIR